MLVAMTPRLLSPRPLSRRSTRSASRPPTVRRALASVAAVAGLVSLTSAVGPAEANSAFQLTMSNSRVVVAQGSTAEVTVSSVRSPGFRNPIFLGVSGLIPRGVTIKAAKNPLTSSIRSTQLRVSAGLNATPRTVRVSVQGSSKGRTARATLTVTVLPYGSVPGTPTVPPATIPSATLPPVPTTAKPPATIPPGVTTTTAPFSDYTLAVDPLVVPLSNGGAATATLKVTKTGGFRDDLFPTVEGMPAGLSATVDPVPGSAATSVVRLQAVESAVPGSYNLTVRARGRSTVFRVDLTRPTITATPSSLTLGRGATGTATVVWNRAASGPVQWTIEGLPTGVTPTFVGTNAATPTATMTLVVGTATVPGNYSPVLKATMGTASMATTFPVTITTAGTVSATVSPASVTLPTGGSVKVRFTPSALPAGAPVLSVKGLPANISATAVALGGGVHDITFAAAANASLATYNVELSLKQGDLVASTNLTIVVAAVAATTTTAPTTTVPGATTTTVATTTTTTIPGATTTTLPAGFVISTTPATVNVARGGTGVITVPVAWNVGVTTRPITFSVSGLPGGVTASYSVNPNAVGTTVYLAVSAAAAVGNSSVTITGTAAGLAPSRATITLNIT